MERYTCACFYILCMQGGGLYIDSGGIATLNSCQVYDNEAGYVVLAFRTF